MISAWCRCGDQARQYWSVLVSAASRYPITVQETSGQRLWYPWRRLPDSRPTGYKVRRRRFSLSRVLIPHNPLSFHLSSCCTVYFVKKSFGTSLFEWKAYVYFLLFFAVTIFFWLLIKLLKHLFRLLLKKNLSMSQVRDCSFFHDLRRMLAFLPLSRYSWNRNDSNKRTKLKNRFPPSLMGPAITIKRNLAIASDWQCCLSYSNDSELKPSGRRVLSFNTNYFLRKLLLQKASPTFLCIFFKC